ncbi:MAG: anaerobic ribonucleoside-triphosphate reductase activating protein, partial [Nanoarchaeota archaeon]|nr:anaerobic ribonucleoside-triphosphate reductase activating protein [Nanoarchaeota archaeon]
MQIAGLQKLTLIDYPDKIACTIFLFGCNFRCGFCHNPELVLSDKPKKEYKEKKILDFLRQRKKYLDAICITGGEPLINFDLPELLKKIKGLGFLVKLDTNGSNPKRLKELISKKLVDYIAMDIKADKDNYNVLAEVKIDINQIEESIKLIINSGLDYEFRTTVIKGYHDAEKLRKIGEWISSFGKAKKYVI